MFLIVIKENSHRTKNRWLFSFLVATLLCWLIPLPAFAHPSPNTLIFLDLSPHQVSMELQLPVPELELAFGHEISKDPGTLIERLGPQIKAYLAEHVHAYVTKGRPWQVSIRTLRMDKGQYADSNIPYWEVVARLILTPPSGETTRKFMLDYDVIMHQVINHVALISVRSDWETGNFHNQSAEAGVIRRNIEDNVIYPYEVTQQRGSWWKGFQSMLTLGMEHIREGTDHLLFLIVLLLPAMLLTNGKTWGSYGGLRYSLVRLLKIITAFTIGHSTTLLISALGWLKLPQQPVEIMIAFSILVSAVHAITPIFPGREMYVAGGFGLIHGLAFAAILSNLNLDAGTLALSILGFNLGIELMQLCIVLLIMPWLVILGKTPAYKGFRIAGAVLAGLMAAAWMTERISGSSNFVTVLLSRAFPYEGWVIISLAVLSITTYYVNHVKTGVPILRKEPLKKT